MEQKRLTENFTLNEFTMSETAEEKKINNTPNDAVIGNLTRLANYLQGIRNCYGSFIKITSGFRSKELNSAVGGAKNSQHLTGEAADISTGSRSENNRLFDLIRKYGGFDQLIDEKNFQWIHVSRRAGRNRGEVLRFDGKRYIKI